MPPRYSTQPPPGAPPRAGWAARPTPPPSPQKHTHTSPLLPPRALTLDLPRPRETGRTVRGQGPHIVTHSVR